MMRLAAGLLSQRTAAAISSARPSNIGVGPSNAKTITDHLAVLRPEAWLMIGHCGGLRATQTIGDYVLAHAYLRDDHVLDDVLPPEIPIPPLAEVQQALQRAAEIVTGESGDELKARLRTGTVVTTDDRNWELRYSLSALASTSRAPSRWTWRAPPSPPRATASAPLRHAALRLRQAAARRDQAARPGQRLLRARHLPAPADRRGGHGPACARRGQAALPQTPQLRRAAVPVRATGGLPPRKSRHCHNRSLSPGA